MQATNGCAVRSVPLASRPSEVNCGTVGAAGRPPSAPNRVHRPIGLSTNWRARE